MIIYLFWLFVTILIKLYHLMTCRRRDISSRVAMIKEFWNKSNGLAKANDMDTNLAYMYTMITEAVGNLFFLKALLYIT